MALPNPAYLYDIGAAPDTGLLLPISFRYKPQVVEKKYSKIPTANGFVFQLASNGVQNGSVIEWEAEGLDPPDYANLITWYNKPLTIGFQGYWGEQLQIIFSVLNDDEITGCMFNLNGEFEVVAVCTAPSYACDSCLGG